MIRLIMSDMDGTLLDENGQIPAEFDALAADLMARGVRFVPASGRQYYALRHQFEKYRDSFIFIAENGTLVKYQEKEIFSSVMPLDRVEAVLAAAEKLSGIYPVFCGKKAAYVTSDYRPFLAEMEKYYTQYLPVDSFADVEDEPIKISLFYDCTEDEAARTIYPVMQQFSTDFQVILSKKFIDITNLGVNKGVAVRALQKHLGIRPEECAAFGDYLNDVEMLSSVQYGYAMENAHPVLKKVARFQAKSNREHGEILAIRQLMAEKLI